MVSRVKIEGLRELRDALRAHSNNLHKKAMRQAVAAGAKVVVRAAKLAAPVRTGDLRRAIRSLRDKRLSIANRTEYRGIGVFKIQGGTYANTRKNRRKGRVGQAYQVEGPQYYWKFNEFGTVKQPARPFLGPALSRNRQAVETAIKDKLAELLIKNTKR